MADLRRARDRARTIGAVAARPDSCFDLHWTYDYGVYIVSKAWLAEIEDLIDETRVLVGEVRHGGRPLTNWATLHEAAAPDLYGTEGWAIRRPNRGYVLIMTRGRKIFIDPNVVGRPLIVNHGGIFVGADLALRRNLRTPAGVFKPGVARYRPGPLML
jgi:hypothetical protein